MLLKTRLSPIYQSSVVIQYNIDKDPYFEIKSSGCSHVTTSDITRKTHVEASAHKQGQYISKLFDEISYY